MWSIEPDLMLNRRKIFGGWMLAGVLALVGANACATGTSATEDDDDGGVSSAGGTGGAGGSSNTGGMQTATTNTVASTVSSTVAATGAQTSSVTTGPMGCDSGLGMDINSVACGDCITCTQTAGCSTEWAACGINSPCDGFTACLSNCDLQCGTNTTCFDTCSGVAAETSSCVSSQGCIAQNPSGCVDYLTALSCSICLQCPLDCDAQNNCS
jgi:hypothetical protein